MTWNIIIRNVLGNANQTSCERIDATGISISPDGSLVLSNGPGTPPVAIYNPRYWLKAEPSAIQAGKMN
jgi:hypothetical protein